jgi:predicted nucleic acid-binding protein
MKMVVLDASLAVKLLVLEAYTPQARALSLYWRSAGIQLIAPDFMPSETATAFRKKISEQTLTLDGAKQLMARFYELRISLRPSWLLHDRAIDLAVELNQRLAYDSHYLALAESLDSDFWTADRPFFGPHPVGIPKSNG